MYQVGDIVVSTTTTWIYQITSENVPGIWFIARRPQQHSKYGVIFRVHEIRHADLREAVQFIVEDQVL